MSPHKEEPADLVIENDLFGPSRLPAGATARWMLTQEQHCDFELLRTGAFAPLSGYLRRHDYEAVCSNMRLASGELWPVPVTLDVSEETAQALGHGAELILQDGTGLPVGRVLVDEVWRPDRRLEAETVYGTGNPEHPGVRRLFARPPMCVAGTVEALPVETALPFQDLRLTPQQVRAEFARQGWKRIVAFQTRNPVHRAHFELTIQAMTQSDARLLLHPVVGPTLQGDVDPFVRVRCYRAIMGRYPKNRAMLAVLPLAMRMAGPREALWHALIRANYGCTHIIVGRDHAGPGRSGDGTSFYEPFAAQDLVAAHESETGVQAIRFHEFAYRADKDVYAPVDEISPGVAKTLSGTRLRQILTAGEEIPSWFTFPEVAGVLAQAFPSRDRRGFTVFFTGLPASGKSTIASALVSRLRELQERSVTLLDGDEVRRLLSSELGFSKEDRHLNIRRIGFVASEVTRAGGIAVCAAIAPYDSSRAAAREACATSGGFVLVHVSTPLATCMQRDPKGLYAKAFAGEIQSFTGVSDPYEPPGEADVTVDTTSSSVVESVNTITRHLFREGWLSIRETPTPDMGQ